MDKRNHKERYDEGLKTRIRRHDEHSPALLKVRDCIRMRTERTTGPQRAIYIRAPAA